VSKIVVLLLFGFIMAMGIAYSLLKHKAPALPVETRIFSVDLIESNFKLRNLTLGGLGSVYGSRGKQLYRIVDKGLDIAPVYTFDNRITAIHERADGLLIVATDDDHWDALKPCRVYRSSDGGQTFELSKTIEGGSALWWSLDSDGEGRLYLAEYGPQRKGMSKTLWRSDDDGLNWRAIYKAPDEDKIHLHRIAVDPFTDDLWLTIGDGTHRLMLTSDDHGDHWQEVDRLQATAVAFGEDAIFWGQDKKGKPGVLRYERKTKTFKRWFNPRKQGNYSGSIYDMVLLPSGELIVPFMKYPEQSHVASVWRGRSGEWTQLMQLASAQGKGAGFENIAGPDKNGWVYMRGYQMKVGAQ
jgi:hypothetical protein